MSYFLETSVAVFITSESCSDLDFNSSISLLALPNTMSNICQAEIIAPIGPKNLDKNVPILPRATAAMFAAPAIPVRAPLNNPSFSVLMPSPSFLIPENNDSVAATSDALITTFFPAAAFLADSALI